MIYLRCAFIIAYLTVLCLYFFSETSGNFKRRAVNKIALAVLFEGYAVGAYLLQKPGGEVSGLVTTAETMADAAREEAVQETAAAPEAADFPTD